MPTVTPQSVIARASARERSDQDMVAGLPTADTPGAIDRIQSATGMDIAPTVKLVLHADVTEAVVRPLANKCDTLGPEVVRSAFARAEDKFEVFEFVTEAYIMQRDQGLPFAMLSPSSYGNAVQPVFLEFMIARIKKAYARLEKRANVTGEIINTNLKTSKNKGDYTISIWVLFQQPPSFKWMRNRQPDQVLEVESKFGRVSIHDQRFRLHINGAMNKLSGGMDLIEICMQTPLQMRFYEMTRAAFELHVGGKRAQALKGKVDQDNLMYQTTPAQLTPDPYARGDAMVAQLEAAGHLLDVKLRDYGYLFVGEIIHRDLLLPDGGEGGPASPSAGPSVLASAEEPAAKEYDEDETEDETEDDELMGAD